ncbi:MAG: transcription antitermination factor NusB [Acidaminococcus sp.]|jgi:N utilization substance protein B|nr:transcription antitermination factor NusB [Acidaminococcus sp.]MCI2099399.1 transcription antitermination factor NusB [Acidaminococcus sp.]MCI2113759.1 transcription antitermination factor NusB [Acidaminococcus sp.]MCI2115667.1 transcription antitermination factor NusB [Acidaminococcus sp.]
MSRREARTVALKSLFSLDFSSDAVPGEVVKELLEDEDCPLKGSHDKAYTLKLVEGTRKNLEAIDAELNTLSKDWAVDRMSGVDRNLMRMAAFEMYYSDEKIPPAVAINEAVEIAKVYGGDESPAFVNGMLGTLVKKHA